MDSAYGEGYETPAELNAAPGSPCGGDGGGGGQGPPWGAYVLQSGLQVVEHDRRFSSQNAVLAAMLRMVRLVLVLLLGPRAWAKSREQG